MSIPPFMKPNSDDIEVDLAGWQATHDENGMIVLAFDRVPSRDRGSRVKAFLRLSPARLDALGNEMKKLAMTTPASKTNN